MQALNLTFCTMGDNKEIEDDLVDYEEYDDEAEGGADKDAGGEKKYVCICRLAPV